MKTKTTIPTTWVALALTLTLSANETDQNLEYPGYRPPTEQADAFAQNVKSSKIAVFPSIIRVVNPKEDRVSQWHSKLPSERTAKYLRENDLGSVEVVDMRFNIGETPKGGQFAVFSETIERIGGQLNRYEGDADYILVLDIIRVRTKAWGLHCYILDREGENAFSFLLNSHHKPFADAAIQMKDNSKQSGRKLVADCTELLLEMLHQQVRMERDIAAFKPDPAIAGKYIGEEDPDSNYLLLKPDGTCELMDEGHYAEGKYAIVGGNTLVLIKDGQRLPVARIEDGKLITNEGKTATRTDDRCLQKNEKPAVIDGFPQATMTIIPGTQNFTGPVDKHRRHYELGKVMSRKEAKGNAELLGLLLEEKGYDASEISAPGFRFPEEEEARKNRAAAFGGFVSKLELETDYALGTEFIFHIEQGIQEVYTVIVDAKGKVAWEDRRKCDETVYDNIDLRKTPERLVLATMVTTRLAPVMGLDALPQRELAPEKKKLLEAIRNGKSGDGSCPLQ